MCLLRITNSVFTLLALVCVIGYCVNYYAYKRTGVDAIIGIALLRRCTACATGEQVPDAEVTEATQTPAGTVVPEDVDRYSAAVAVAVPASPIREHRHSSRHSSRGYGSLS